jgi:ABC-2 type transport system permease protein
MITMRLFAHEKSTGTYETLMTAPVSDGEVVLAKFSAAWLFYAAAVLPLLGVLLLVHHYASPGEPFEWSTTASTFGGILLIGSTYLAMGCLASALTRSQIVAATVSFALGVTFFLLSFLQFTVGSQSGWVAQVVTYASLFGHMEDFVRGVVDTRPVVFHLSLIGFWLFLNLKVVESRRWS